MCLALWLGFVGNHLFTKDPGVFKGATNKKHSYNILVSLILFLNIMNQLNSELNEEFLFELKFWKLEFKEEELTMIWNCFSIL